MRVRGLDVVELMFREDPRAEPYPATVVISGQGETFPSLPSVDSLRRLGRTFPSAFRGIPSVTKVQGLSRFLRPMHP